MMNTIQIVAMLMERFANKFPSEIKVGGFGKHEKTTYIVTFPYYRNVKFTFDAKSDDVLMEFDFEHGISEPSDGDFIYSLAETKDNKELYPFKVFEISEAYDCYDEATLFFVSLYTRYHKNEFTKEVLDSLVKLMLKPTPTLEKLISMKEY